MGQQKSPLASHKTLKIVRTGFINSFCVFLTNNDLIFNGPTKKSPRLTQNTEDPVTHTDRDAEVIHPLCFSTAMQMQRRGTNVSRHHGGLIEHPPPPTLKPIEHYSTIVLRGLRGPLI